MQAAVMPKPSPASKILWVAVAIIGAFCLGVVALRRGEPINAIWLVAASIAIFVIGYRFYGKFIADTVLRSTRRARRPRCCATTASTTCRPTSGWCSATTSPRSPAPARWSARCWPRRWATCPARCGSCSAWCSPARCRTS